MLSKIEIQGNKNLPKHLKWNYVKLELSKKEKWNWEWN